MTTQIDTQFSTNDTSSNLSSESPTKKSSLRKLLLWGIFLTFTPYSFWVMYEVGYFGIWAGGFLSLGSTQILIDLVIACLLFSSWMIGDARHRGVNVAPWLVGVLTSGSVAALAYLLAREYGLGEKQKRTPSAIKS